MHYFLAFKEFLIVFSYSFVVVEYKCQSTLMKALRSLIQL